MKYVAAQLFIVLDGQLDIAVREPEQPERVVHLARHDAYVVPHGIEHRPVSEHGAAILLLEPSGTLSTSDHEGAVPDHITSTTGVSAD